MTAKGRILYLVQFDAAEAAVSWQVAELAKAWQTAVVLLAVCRPRWLSMLGKEELRAGKRELLGVARRMRQLRAYVGGVRVLAGEPVAEACRMAEQLGVELVMVGAHAQLAPGIARRARQDVWICKPDADPQLEHVLCAADTSKGAARAIQRSVDLCRRFNARMRLLSVLGPAARPEGLAEFLGQFDLRGVSLSRAVVRGAETAVELLLEAERYADGLLVMGAASRTRAPGLGATAEPMVRACPSSVLVVRERAALAGTPAGDTAGTEVAIT